MDVFLTVIFVSVLAGGMLGILLERPGGVILGREAYDHILDEGRKVNTQRIESGFYAKSNLRNVEQSLRSETAQQPGLDAVQLLLQLQANPELATLLKGLLNANLFG